MKTLAALLVVAMLTGCPGFRPYARADQEGFQLGISGEWKAIAVSILQIWRKDQCLPDFSIEK